MVQSVAGLGGDSSGFFQDRSSNSGILTTLQNSQTPQKHQIETMPGGVAVFDYDNDGYPDIYFANGAEQPSLEKTGPQFYNRLYRNRGNWTFEDVTEKAGVRGRGYDMGVAAGDYDNDGNIDLFITGVHGNTLFRNRGDGRFEDVTTEAGLGGGGWTVSAAWLDYDSDGLLDLFVVSYVKWDPAAEPFCGDAQHSIRTYCHPRFYDPQSNHLYHNNGDGTFTDVSVSSGIAAHRGKGMGVVVADYDQDGWPDIFVANDTVPNFLFHNEHNGHFSEVAFQAGVAVNDDGRALSSMGADFRDLNNDGYEDLFVTALASETFPYFQNSTKGSFSDLTYPSGIGAATVAVSGWGVGIVDLDNDGWKDIFTANGDVQDNNELFSSRTSRQRNLLLLNDRKGFFQPQLIGAPSLYRGLAFGDFDRDGRMDVVVTRLNDTPVLLRNMANPTRHWLNLKLVGHRSNREAIGARVLLRGGTLKQINHVTSSLGYESSSEPTVHFGLGERAIADSIEILWPSGTRQILKNVPADHYITVNEP
jgi:hypothetical protein